MIGYRGGTVVTICDGCYRPQRTGEWGWTHSPDGGFQEAAARPTPPSGTVATVEVTQRAQPLDYCPGCAAVPSASSWDRLVELGGGDG